MSTWPSPHTLVLHWSVQSPLSLFWVSPVEPLSHCSTLVPSVSLRPSPHTLIWHFDVQSLLSALPGPPPAASHCSVLPPLSGTTNSVLSLPSPHEGVVQSALHVGELTPLESHASCLGPIAVSVKPSPQRAVRHCVVQSPLSLLAAPRSHSSRPSLMPSPHDGSW